MTNSGIVTNLTVKCLGNISFEYDDGCDSCVTEETNMSMTKMTIQFVLNFTQSIEAHNVLKL